MATTYQYLLRRKAELETRMVEAQRRAQAPFESELRAILLALDALRQAGMAERLTAGEAPAFAPPTPGKRGRRGRSTRDMILMTLAQAPGLNEAEIARQLDHRWSRPVTPAVVGRELEPLAMEGLVKRSGAGWVRVEEPTERTEAEPSFLAASGH
ncbi:hypothetical protein CA606_13125 [Caulobacter vibrioides]|uniref:Uncharacterized protein n=1 Tax=Caulobacter vibrioides TaxID=155892 RepID=A0A290MMH3_CAUVI|nr:hypothetical protein [Caulobacter vibrioides]ATC33189.1 hypothetical protein CA606_13125 [Caulobacter vibrioides]